MPFMTTPLQNPVATSGAAMVNQMPKEKQAESCANGEIELDKEEGKASTPRTACTEAALGEAAQP